MKKILLFFVALLFVIVGHSQVTYTWVKADSTIKIGSDANNIDGVLLFEASDGDQLEVKINTDDQLIVTGASDISLGTGVGNTVTDGSFAAGVGNTATGNTSTSIGSNNTSTGAYAISVGRVNTATGDNSKATGRESVASLYGEVAHAARKFGTNGDAQMSDMVARLSQTHSDATWYTLFLDGTDDRLVLPAGGSAWTFSILIVGITADAAQTWSYKIEGAVEKTAAGALTVLAGPVTTIAEADADFDTQVVDGGSGDLAIQVQGDATGYVVRWVARVQLVQVIF